MCDLFRIQCFDLPARHHEQSGRWFALGHDHLARLEGLDLQALKYRIAK